MAQDQVPSSGRLGTMKGLREGVTVALVVLAAACSESRSPFPLWDMRVGMSFAELDSISLHDQQARFTCVRSHLGFRTCSVPLRGSPGRMDALVDSTDTVVELTFWTGSDHLMSNAARGGGRSYDMVMGLHNQSLRLVEGWRDVTASDTVYSEEGGWTETWLAGEGRWIARVAWQGTGLPGMMMTADAEVAHMHALAVARAEGGAEGGVVRGQARAQDSDTEHVVRSELLRLVRAQRAFREQSGRHANALAPLRFIPREDVLVEIEGARPAGWWARAWTEDGSECVVWDGIPPPGTRDFQGEAGEPLCS